MLSAATGKDVSVEAVFECPTIPELGEMLDAMPSASPRSSPSVECAASARTGPQPLSSIQESIWIDHQSRAPDNRYNIPIRIDFPPDIPRERIEASFALELSRAELLRSEIFWCDGRLSQLTSDEEGHRLDVLDLLSAGAAQAMAELDAFARALVLEPFNLDERPLFRAALARLPGEAHVLFFVAHHIVCDGFSLVAFAQRMLASCGAARAGIERPAADRGSPYQAYVRRQRELLRAMDRTPLRTGTGS